MTVQYYQDVLTVGTFTFVKLLLRWKGSVVKLVFKDFLVFSLLYAAISAMYRFLLKVQQQRTFEHIVIYVSNLQSFIPITLLLGFYVSVVFNRFWKHFNTVPWITKTAMLLSSHLNPKDASDTEKMESRMQKRSIIRYLVAAEVLTLSRVSVPVKLRFPQLIDLYTKGILMEHEIRLIAETQPCTMQPFLPIAWCTSIVVKASDQGRITNDLIVVSLIKEINRYRHGLQELFLLDHVCVPLVYTQVVTLAVYSYFASCLIGSQFVIRDPSNQNRDLDLVVPFFTVLQFIVYVGWLKLALALVNPMGEDDEDFDLNTLVDYNFEVGLAIIDNLNENQPNFEKDKFFATKDFDLPMKTLMRDSKIRPFMGSTYNLKTEDDSWVTSMRSIVTVNSEGPISAFIGNKSPSLNTIEVTHEDISRHLRERSESIRSSRKHPIHRQASASSFKSSIFSPIREEIADNLEASISASGIISSHNLMVPTGSHFKKGSPDLHEIGGDIEMETVTELPDRESDGTDN